MNYKGFIYLELHLTIKGDSFLHFKLAELQLLARDAVLCALAIFLLPMFSSCLVNLIFMRQVVSLNLYINLFFLFIFLRL